MVRRGPAPRSSPDPAWVRRLLRAGAPGRALHDAARCSARSGAALHLAVLREPHLSRLMSGEKTVEGRACRVRRAPMGVVRTGDVVLVKRAAGPVVGWCTVRAVSTFDLAESDLAVIRAHHDEAMGRPGPDFWGAVEGSASAPGARFLTIIELAGVRGIVEPVPCGKSDRRAWVVLRPRRDRTRRAPAPGG